MRVVIVTDAWLPQVNGVVTTLQHTCAELEEMGHEVKVICPESFKTIPCPGYNEIQLSLFARRQVFKTLRNFLPSAIHIATEGPLGRLARAYCRRRRLPFTTAYHTQFPEYLKLRGVPLSWTYAYVRRFHGAACATMVSTPNQRQALQARGFDNLRAWGRGVDTSVFHPDVPAAFDLPGPVAVYVGRVAVEKNITAMLEMKSPGSKLVIGSGPDLDKFKQAYPDVHFAGYRFGEELVSYLRSGDVFVFPSRTDTFGLVMLEAMAAGLPVAAYPVTGPVDVVSDGVSGALDDDLDEAFRRALKLHPENAVAHAQNYSWRAATEQFVNNLAPIEFGHVVRNLAA